MILQLNFFGILIAVDRLYLLLIVSLLLLLCCGKSNKKNKARKRKNKNRMLVYKRSTVSYLCVHTHIHVRACMCGYVYVCKDPFLLMLASPYFPHLSILSPKPSLSSFFCCCTQGDIYRWDFNYLLVLLTAGWATVTALVSHSTMLCRAAEVQMLRE